MYEDQLIYAAERLFDGPEGMESNVVLESFAVHARCLFDFLWGKGNDNYENDAFAFHFADDWNGRRGAIPPYLAEIKEESRFGREVMHLTYDRIDGPEDAKLWPCGEVLREIGTALRLFSELARDEALDDYTRQRLGSVVVESRDDDGGLLSILPHGFLAAAGAATTLVPGDIDGGPSMFRLLKSGLRVGYGHRSMYSVPIAVPMSCKNPCLRADHVQRWRRS